MTTLLLTTVINADIKKCFDIARDVDAHKLSTIKTNERAIAGRTSGLCELGDKIMWEAVHFGIKQRLSVEIIAMEKYTLFEDKMTKGAFKSMDHRHEFEQIGDCTIMKDIFRYEVPFGIIGKLFDELILKKYMTNFLSTRNRVLKSIAEQASAANCPKLNI